MDAPVLAHQQKTKFCPDSGSRRKDLSCAMAVWNGKQESWSNRLVGTYWLKYIYIHAFSENLIRAAVREKWLFSKFHLYHTKQNTDFVFAFIVLAHFAFILPRYFLYHLISLEFRYFLFFWYWIFIKEPLLWLHPFHFLMLTSIIVFQNFQVYSFLRYYCYDPI